MHPRLRDFGKFIDNLEVYKVHGTFEHLYSPATDEIFVSFVGFDNNQKVISKLWRWPESTVATDLGRFLKMKRAMALPRLKKRMFLIFSPAPTLVITLF